MKPWTSLILVATFITSPAFAEEGGEPPDAPPAEDYAAERAQRRDAAIDRGFLTSHAENIGEDKWAINAYELIFVGLTYGFTDDIQVSLSTLLPVTTDIPLVLALQGKFVLARTGDTIFSLRTPLVLLDDGDSDTTLGYVGVGALVDQYLDRDGRFALHAGLLVAGVFGSFSEDDFQIGEGAAFQLDLGVSLAVAKILKIIVEVQLGAAATEDGFELAEAALVNYGVRFFGESIAGDLGFIFPAGVDSGDLLLGLPYLAFSARF